MTKKKTNIFSKIYNIVKTIPKGKVMTYKQVSLLANVANARVVGFAMAANKDPKHIPCHRVIKYDGSLAKGYAFGDNQEKIKKLREEGVLFDQNGRVDMEKYLFVPPL